MSNVIDSHKTIFIHIPKNAGTSILKAFNIDTANHEKWFYFKRKYPNKWNNYFKFAIVRNPWDRIVSNYEYARLKKSYWHSIDGKAIYGKHKDYDLLKNKSFEETVFLLKKQHNLFKHQGWGNQFSYVCNKKNIPQVKILRFENLEADFKQLFPNINLPKTNKSREKNNYKNYYNKETRQIVATIYKKDIQLFNYSF